MSKLENRMRENDQERDYYFHELHMTQQKLAITEDNLTKILTEKEELVNSLSKIAEKEKHQTQLSGCKIEDLQKACDGYINANFDLSNQRDKLSDDYRKIKRDYDETNLQSKKLTEEISSLNEQLQEANRKTSILGEMEKRLTEAIEDIR